MATKKKRSTNEDEVKPPKPQPFRKLFDPKYVSPPVLEDGDDIYLCYYWPQGDNEDISRRLLRHTTETNSKSWEREKTKGIDKKMCSIYWRDDDYYDVPSYRVVTEKKKKEIHDRIASGKTTSYKLHCNTKQGNGATLDSKHSNSSRSTSVTPNTLPAAKNDEKLASLLDRLCRPTGASNVKWAETNKFYLKGKFAKDRDIQDKEPWKEHYIRDEFSTEWQGEGVDEC